MKKTLLHIACALLLTNTITAQTVNQTVPTLKEAYKSAFKIG